MTTFNTLKQPRLVIRFKSEYLPPCPLRQSANKQARLPLSLYAKDRLTLEAWAGSTTSGTRGYFSPPFTQFYAHRSSSCWQYLVDSIALKSFSNLRTIFLILTVSQRVSDTDLPVVEFTGAITEIFPPPPLIPPHPQAKPPVPLYAKPAIDISMETLFPLSADYFSFSSKPG